MFFQHRPRVFCVRPDLYRLLWIPDVSGLAPKLKMKNKGVKIPMAGPRPVQNKTFVTVF